MGRGFVERRRACRRDQPVDARDGAFPIRLATLSVASHLLQKLAFAHIFSLTINIIGSEADGGWNGEGANRTAAD
jgi:hypothetical protein